MSHLADLVFPSQLRVATTWEGKLSAIQMKMTAETATSLSLLSNRVALLQLARGFRNADYSLMHPEIGHLHFVNVAGSLVDL